MNTGGEESLSARPMSYYDVLGVREDSSNDEIRRAYHSLAMRWHPDKCNKNQSSSSEAKRKFQEIQEAYSVLSDYCKRTLYDCGLYDPEEEQDEGFADFVEELVSLMGENRKEENECSMEELQNVFTKMVEDFNTPLSNWGIPSSFSGVWMDQNKTGYEGSAAAEHSYPNFGLSGVEMYRESGFCS